MTRIALIKAIADGVADAPVRRANLLLLCLVISENCFGLVDANLINIAGVININLLWQVLLLILSMALYWKSARAKTATTSVVQGLFMAALIFLCFVAAYRCMELTGQPFARGIIPQRSFIVCVLAAIMLRRPFQAGMIDCDRFVKGILVLGTISALVYLAQAAVGSSFTFVHALSGEKYGGLRLFIDSALSTTSGLLGFWCCLRYDNWRPAVPTLLALGVILFVSKGRLELVVYLAAVLSIFLTAKGGVRARVLLVCVIGLASIFVVQTEYFNKVAVSFMNGQIGGSEDTTTIRECGRKYYDFVLNSVPEGVVFGCGYPSDLYRPATEMAGFQNFYLLSDNGVYAFRYVYGNLGIAVLLLVLVSCLWFGLKGRDDHLGPAILAFFLFLILPATNLAWWWCVEDWEVMTALIIALSWQKNIQLRGFSEKKK